ncbi:MAG: Flp pilus assembly complex ATPase component TadA [Desulfobacterales bacterium]|uniref:Flp pilus assembly complex ATPase component TadA n=1 Tax=Candidatus Desulfatibia vada TaxID=2841696 RepID=A0A8J6NZP6_9BACT|nr:Flp pilus assembly complex ATPase component TadA [Candidatus Desulfatibia vada]
MDSKAKPLILSIDDEPDTLRLINRFLTRSGYDVITADSGLKGLEAISKVKPSLILLDIMMPEMNGYEFCSRLQKRSDTAYIPVIFVTALGDEQDKARAFAVGGVDYLVKPIEKDALIRKVRKHIKTDARWKALKRDAVIWHEGIQPADFIQFKEFLFAKLKLNPDKKYELFNIAPSKIYSISSKIGINNRKMAQYIAKFLKLPYISTINPEDVQLGVLPIPFCKSNHVVAVSDASSKSAFVLGNPFDGDHLENLKKFMGVDKTSKLIISEPENIDMLFRYGDSKPTDEIFKVEDEAKLEKRVIDTAIKPPESEIKKQPIVYIANTILAKAVSEKASDIHILPKEKKTVIRYRIDGDLKEIYALKKQTGDKIISRFKVFGGLDITEKRKPQDGVFAAIIDERTFTLRISTTLTPNGESIIIRLLEPYAKPRELQELGMADKQVNALLKMANRSGGLILIVGPTGSGKTTTIYSLLHKIDCETRNLISVEDPVEYRIPFANQQQVNERVGVTFEALLKSSVRQDPDILFMGEVRDRYSAKMSLDFASTGHLTMTTLHTSNATTAIFRLERLEIDRGAMADTLLAIVAQRLLKKLCPLCKKTEPISKEETRMLSPFTNAIPSRVAHPVGCMKCNNTGYYGREGIYEVLQFDAEISEMVRSNMPISEIRSFAQQRGTYLKSQHAIEKVKNLIFAPKDVYEKVLVEEVKLKRIEPEKTTRKTALPDTETADQASILVADDDQDARELIALFLKNRGYSVTTSEDGIDALLNLGKKEFDLVLSDVDMPNFDGFKLLEMINQKGIATPVIFLTSRTSDKDEKRGLELGALDYIKKPIQKEILLLRVNSVLSKVKKSG